MCGALNVPQAAIAAPGDFNGDGYDDLAIGVLRESVGKVERAGAVNVLYGSSTGLTADDDQIWHRDIEGVEGEPEAATYFGHVLTQADFDGDGYDDLAVSTFDDFGLALQAGSVQVLYGSWAGLTATGDEIWSQYDSDVRGIAELDDEFGLALAAADFDGDGYADLAVGVPYESVGDVAAAGAVNVLYGSSGGLTAAGDQIWHRDSNGVLGETGYNEIFGVALAAGDFDCDGFDDLAIGSPQDGSGAVNILYGTALGLSAVGDQLWTPDSAGLTGPGGDFGGALVAGNFDGFSCDDLAIGDERADANNKAEAGAVHVLYGALGGLSADRVGYWHQAVAGVRGIAEVWDHFGSALAACDYDGNGADDLAVAAKLEDVGDVLEAGSVNILYGLSGVGLTADDDQIWHQDSEGMPDTAEPYDYFGEALGGGDFDGDGRCDLAIGVSSESIGELWSTGAVYVLYGEGPEGLSAARAEEWYQGTAGVRGKPEVMDYFGSAL